MRSETLLCQLLVLSTRLAVIGIRPDADTATRSENTSHLNVLRIHQTDEILHDDVHTVLMKITMIAETEKIEFQTLTFHHLHIRNITDAG